MSGSVLDRLDVRRAYQLVTGHSADGPERAGQVRVRCPSAGHRDEHPSCDLSPARNAFACRSCDAAGGVLDLPIVAGHVHDRAGAAAYFEERVSPRGYTSAPRTSATVAGLAAHKRFDPDFLLRLGLVDDDPRGVRIPFHNTAGEVVTYRLREFTETAHPTKWGPGPRVAYCLPKTLALAHERGEVVIVEGESDVWTLALHNTPAVGIPGSTMSRLLDAMHVLGIARVYVVREPGDAGRKFVRDVAARLAAVGWHGDLRVVDLHGVHGVKDPSALHIADPEHFAEQWESAVTAAELDHSVGEEPNIPQLVAVDAVDLITRPFTPPAFLVNPIVPRHGSVLLTGDTGSGKTALTMHLVLCIITQMPVGGRFMISEDTRPVLVLNGEMGSDLLISYLHQAAAGLGIATIPRGRLLFEGPDGVAQFCFSESRAALEKLVADVHPCAIFFDTQRALFGLNENDTEAVRAACDWLHDIAEKYRLVNMLNHHVRKLGPVSNSDRERVAGSRDWVAGVDVHLIAKSRDGRPMHALSIGKTRMPTAEAMTGTEWPIEARLELREEPPRSIIVAADPVRASEVSSLEDAIDELVARLEAEGPMTIEQMGATKGNVKRAYESLRQQDRLVEVGKDGRKSILGLVGLHEPDKSAKRTRSAVDRTRDRGKWKANSHEGLNAVSPRPRSDRDSTSGPVATAARPSAGGATVPPTVVGNDERGHGHVYNRTALADRVRAEGDNAEEFDV